MNINTTIKPAVTLEEKLDQAGHLWAVEQTVKAIKDRELLADESWRWTFAENLVEKAADWGIETTLDHTFKLLADLTVRFHNLDIDGRSANLPPNRYNTR